MKATRQDDFSKAARVAVRARVAWREAVDALAAAQDGGDDAAIEEAHEAAAVAEQAYKEAQAAATVAADDGAGDATGDDVATGTAMPTPASLDDLVRYIETHPKALVKDSTACRAFELLHGAPLETHALTIAAQQGWMSDMNNVRRLIEVIDKARDRAKQAGLAEEWLNRRRGQHADLQAMLDTARGWMEEVGRDLQVTQMTKSGQLNRRRFSVTDRMKIEIMEESYWKIRQAITKYGLAGKTGQAAAKKDTEATKQSTKQSTSWLADDGRYHVRIGYWSRTSNRAGNHVVVHAGQDYNNSSFKFGWQQLRYGRVTDATVWEADAAGLRSTIDSVIAKRDLGVAEDRRRLIQYDRASSPRYTPECKVKKDAGDGDYIAVISRPEDDGQRWQYVERIYFRPHEVESAADDALVKDEGKAAANYLTKEEEAELRQELKYLIEVRRPALTQALRDAAARQSKIKKNADYHDTKEQQSFIEGRIQHIKAILQNATVVEYQGPSDEVRIGSTVIIHEDGMNDDEEYKIVGSAGANTRERKISWKSPIGSALLGKKKGSEVKVYTPRGLVKFRIVDIR